MLVALNLIYIGFVVILVSLAWMKIIDPITAIIGTSFGLMVMLIATINEEEKETNINTKE